MLILPKILLPVFQLVFAQLTNTNLVVVRELSLQKALKLFDPVVLRTFCFDVNLEVFGGLYVAHVALAKINIVTDQRPCKIRILLMWMDTPAAMIGGGMAIRHATEKTDGEM